VITRVVVAGYGNPLRGDDGVGWRVAEAIGRRWDDQVGVLTGPQPLPEWSLALAAADMAFFVDAGVNAGARLRLRQVYAVGGGRSGHLLTIEDVLGLTKALYGRAPESYALELPLHDVGFGEHLSPATARAATRAVRLLNRRLARLL
jgi:hydrogenase maturation protease